MQLRISTEPHMGASDDDLQAVALTAEECGFEAFFRSDHYLAFPWPSHSWAVERWATGMACLAQLTLG